MMRIKSEIFREAQRQSQPGIHGNLSLVQACFLRTLREDAKNPESSADFGGILFPALLDDDKRLCLSL